MVGIGSSRQEGEGVRDSQGPGYREPGGLRKGCLSVTPNVLGNHCQFLRKAIVS